MAARRPVTLRARAPALLAALVVGAAAPAPSARAADDGAPWDADPWVRVDLGADVGTALGGKVTVAAEPARWSFGALGVGVWVAGHAHAWKPAATGADDGLAWSGLDADVRAAVYLGHVFRFADRRLGVGVHAYSGLVSRWVDTRVRDDAHDLDLSQRHQTLTSETGVRVEVPVRLSRRLGLVVDGTMPLFVLGQPGLPLSWDVAGPTVGLALSVHL